MTWQDILKETSHLKDAKKRPKVMSEEEYQRVLAESDKPWTNKKEFDSRRASNKDLRNRAPWGLPNFHSKNQPNLTSEEEFDEETQRQLSEDTLKADTDEKELELTINREIYDLADYRFEKVARLESLLQRQFNNDDIEVEYVADDRAFYIKVLGKLRSHMPQASRMRRTTTTYKFDRDGNFSEVY